MASSTPVTEFPERPDPAASDWADFVPDHLARYEFAGNYARGKMVLDAGTGPGYGAVALHEAGARRVVAVDIDAPTIETARKRYGAPGLEFVVDDCHTLATVQGPVDVIASFENIEHLPEPKRFLAAACQRMADDGVMICSSPDRACPFNQWVNGKPANPFHFHEWYDDEFVALLSEYFHSVDLLYQVMAHSAMARRQAAVNLEKHIEYLWANPVRRAVRVASKFLGARKEWLDVRRLAAATPAEYPLVSRRLSGIYGVPHVLVAVCKRPRR